MTTLTRRYARLAGVLPVAVGLAACANQSARAPNPTGYDWPDAFAYRIELVAAPGADAPVVSRYEETKLLRFAIRNDRYLAWNDSVAKVRPDAGAGAEPGRVAAADTLHWYVRLTRLGEFNDVEPDCDPSVATCHDVHPSTLPLELRRVVPRLPVWWPPKGHPWADTLRFDDLPRPSGTRGSLITTYRDRRDTVLDGRAYWVVDWTSEMRAERRAGGVMVADPAARESGEVLVDKQRLVPVLARWHGAPAPSRSPQARGGGVAATAFRGRARLVGSALDSGQVGR